MADDRPKSVKDVPADKFIEVHTDGGRAAPRAACSSMGELAGGGPAPVGAQAL